MRSNSKRGEILASASYIVENLGMDKLTLEAVANKTGISKGGLLHHFRNKEALIEGMIIEYTEQFIEELTSITSKSNEQGKWIRAYLNVILNDKALVSGLAASVAQ
ncbi:TetR/AcrR family transcriptional regulator [Paenibacillus sp. Marseille-Q7038]